MDNDVLPLMHPLTLLNSSQYEETGLVTFNHAEYKLCAFGFCNESLFSQYPAKADLLVEQFAINPAVSHRLLSKTQLYHLQSLGIDSSMMLFNRRTYMPKISRILTTLITDITARKILFGNASSDLGLFKYAAASEGDREIVPFAFILSGLDFGRSNWLSLWGMSTGIVMYQFNPMEQNYPRLFYLQGPGIESFHGVKDANLLNVWGDKDSPTFILTHYSLYVSQPYSPNMVIFPGREKRTFSTEEKIIINQFYLSVWGYANYFPMEDGNLSIS
jgi:hypothetical protein